MLDLDLFQRQTEVVWNSFSFWKITELRSWKTERNQPRVKRDTKKTEILCLKMQDPENQGFKSYFSRTDDSRNQHEETQEHEYSAEGFQSFAQDTTLHGARFLFVSNVSRRVVWNIAMVSCFSFCAYQVFQSVRAFDSYPFHTTVKRETARSLSAENYSDCFEWKPQERFRTQFWLKKIVLNDLNILTVLWRQSGYFKIRLVQ